MLIYGGVIKKGCENMPENDIVDIKKKHGKTKKKKYRHVYTGSEKVRIFFGVLVANVTLC